MSRTVLRGTAALAAVVGGVVVWSGFGPYDPDPWLADFAAVRNAMAAGYANLDWKVSRGEVDPYRLTLVTDSTIRTAGSDRAARRALHEFVDAFQDGHLRLERPHPILDAIEVRLQRGIFDRAVTGELSAGEACKRLGYDQDDSPPLLAHAPGYVPLPSDTNAFQAGTLPVDGAGTLGVVRIPLFSAGAYRPVCERVWPGFSAALAAEEPCDGDCEDRLAVAVEARMTAELGRRVLELEAAGAGAIAVDLTGNGGGSNWVDPAARVLTRRTLRSPRVSFVRHPHWVPVFEGDLRAVERDLARADLDSVRRDLLAEARGRYAHALNEAREPCDVTDIWRLEAPSLSCRNIGSAELYATGAYGWLAPGSVAGLGSAESLFWPAARGTARGVGTVPLIVLVDGRTASASEYFTAMLRDNDAALVVGEPTYGAGCGYTNGGIPTTLSHSGLRLRMPDCLRLRADGTNEVAGIRPDVSAGWADDDDEAARAAKARAAVARLDLVTGAAR